MKGYNLARAAYLKSKTGKKPHSKHLAVRFTLKFVCMIIFQLSEAEFSEILQ